jgi:hypothetical protein
MPALPRTTPEPPPVSGARWIPLTRGYFALVDEADFVRASAFTWSLRPAGRKRAHLYAVAWVEKKHLYLHNFIMGTRDRIDHENRDGLNCRRENLRLATKAQNQQNAIVRSNSQTGLKGVTFAKDRGYYRANIQVDGKRTWLGNFSDPKDAARAYNEAAVRLFGEFARINEGA